MASFKTEDYGKLINEDLSIYLRKHTDKHDRAHVSEETGIGPSTIRNVVYRTHTMTASSSKAIERLILVAIENCRKQIRDAKDAEKELSLMVAS
ncbi:hypothetical protein [Winogradskyella forsetii]|uniref:hypothetical protein n=1 Tax=Winogradskyella forsetii TaxID=2686077 RepID=UPI0015B8E5F9|nr:hypothetical protein [Winogradskyella forsetii]